MTSTAKVDSAYAKLGPGGQVTCTLCNCPVKSTKVWIAHVNGRQHRENLASRSKPDKGPQKSLSTRPAPVPQKRPPTDETKNGDHGAVKKAKTFVNEPITRPLATVVKSTEAASKPAISAVSDTISMSKTIKNEPVASSSDLPADFFDVSTGVKDVRKADEEEENEEEKEPETSSLERAVKGKGEDIPEGFFDDRKKDAKVRGVELKDPLDDEWNKFQKELQKVEAASEQIVEEDEGQMVVERELDEAEELIREWSRVHELEKRKESILGPDDTRMDQESETAAVTREDSDDEMDEGVLKNVFAWRSKDVWK